MAAAFNKFSKLQGTLERVAEMRPTAPNTREKMASVVLSTGGSIETRSRWWRQAEAAFSDAYVVE
jgi:hypothetical protein